MSQQYSTRAGTTTIILSCVMFGGIYFITPFMAPLGGIEVWAFRIIVNLPVVALILLAMKQLPLFTDIWVRITRNPLLILGLLATSFLLSVQLWLFGWAPLHGRGLQVALGYFLLPLVLVVVGRVLYRDKLKWWHWIAAAVAAVGVTFAIVNEGGISWEPLVVCFGYPLYFVLRRALGTANTGGMLWEFIFVLPVAIWFLVREFTTGTAFIENPHLWWFAPLFGFLASIALWLYVISSRLLPISIFGLLTYLEPALLAVAAVLIGERILAQEFVLYGSIWAAVLILLIGGITDLVRSRGRPLM